MDFRKDKIVYIYNVILGLLFLVVIFTPYIINDGVSILNEEMVEAIMIFGLVLLGSYIYSKYEAYIFEKQESYNDIVRHIGALNLQIGQIKSVLDATKNHPTSSKEMKNTLGVLCGTILGIVNVDWAMIRVIEKENFRTNFERIVFRGNKKELTLSISNKEIVSGIKNKEFYFGVYDCRNGKILACIVPEKEIDSNQELIIKTVVNNAGMIYLLYSNAKDEKKA